MARSLILLVFVIAGLALTFRFHGRKRRRLLWTWLVGVLLAGGGCVGALGWLGAETSGRANLFHAVPPILWSGLFVAGAVIIVLNTLHVLIEAGRPKPGRQTYIPKNDE